jgi:biopolymer transport protein ExbB
MSEIAGLLDEGGHVMWPLMALALLLYERCFNLLVLIWQTRRASERTLAVLPGDRARARFEQERLRDTFRQHRMLISALVAAAPLLGLLGTVMGMVNTFTSIGGAGGERSMEGLASGISMALITTETGLSIAIPAVIMLYYAQRQMQKGIQRLNAIEGRMMEAA